jgi:pantetheine-phosphate adenylyltransferase
MKEKRTKCVFAGTFDPPTLGHKAVVDDCLQMFDEVVVAMLVNREKTPFFTVEQRMHMWALMYPSAPNLKIVSFEGTVAELLRREDTNIYVRGIRNGVDLDYENANFYASKKLMGDLITVYLPCRQELLHIHSTMVRNSLVFGTPIDEYVTAEVKAYIQEIYKEHI